MQIITISRQTASGGNEIAEQLAKRLGFKLINRDYVLEKWLPDVADDHQLHMLKQSRKFYNRRIEQKYGLEKDLTFAGFIENRLRDLAKEKNLLIVGLGAQVIFKNHSRAIHIKIVASDEYRVNKISKKYGLKKEQAERTIELSDRKKRRYVWQVHEVDWSDPTLYHLSINSAGINLEQALSILSNLADFKKESPEALNDKNNEEEQKKEHNFAHPSEKEFAKILDMHHIKWEYEPTEFPLEWDAEGNISMGFRPDFYLTEYDTYIELTTMKRKYVTEKNKKVKLLKETYPHINVKIVYKKDFHTLVEKFNFNKGE
nr:cytidylate kinase family protein [Halanaerobium hydrogeniformans]